MNLAEWLRAQLDEDKRTYRHLYDLGEQGSYDFLFDEIESKRRIIDECAPIADLSFLGSGVPPGDDTELAALTLALLALPYSDRPGYRDEWRP